MNYKTNFLALLLCCTSLLYSQDIQFWGTPFPGNAMVGRTDSIEKVQLDGKDIRFDATGTFFFGFDRNDTGTHTITVAHTNGSTETKDFVLPEREYTVQKINSKKKQFSSPPENELARIKKEKEMMVAARTKIGVIDTAYYKSSFQRPVKGGRITGVFGSQRILNGTPQNIHDGLDIALPAGTPVYAMADGIVQIAEENFYYNGTFVFINHGQNLTSVYIHFSKLSVKTGDFVKKGQKIGEVGTTGRSTAPHLHWGVVWNGKMIDPNSLLEIKF